MDLEQRIKGKLPQINIAGTMFYVDIHMGCLRADYQLMAEIKFDRLEEDPLGNSYRFAFNTATKQMVTIDPGIKRWPKNTVILETPNERRMDPYGWARSYGLDPIAYTKKHPFEKEWKAKIIPLEKTEFPAMMRKNNNEPEKLLKKKTRTRNKTKGRKI